MPISYLLIIAFQAHSLEKNLQEQHYLKELYRPNRNFLTRKLMFLSTLTRFGDSHRDLQFRAPKYSLH